MKALNYDESVKESIVELRVFHQKQSSSLFRRRLQFLMLLKSGKCCSQAKAGALIGIKQRASEKLWKLYSEEGLQGLLRTPEKGRPAKLTEAAKAALQAELDQSRVTTLKQACSFVEQQHGIRISQVAMHYYFSCEKIKKKTGRPTRIRKDLQGEEGFKKSLSFIKAALQGGHLL
jgi:transposase